MRAMRAPAAVTLLAAVALLAVRTAPAGAQETTVRAVAIIHSATGEETVELMSPLTPGEIAAVERRLAAEGHRPGAVDGRLDEEARRALRAFQRAADLPVCGCVDPATVRALGLELRVLVTRLAEGGAGSGGGERPYADGGAGVEVHYPSTAGASSAGAASDASSATGPTAGAEPAPGPSLPETSAAGVEDVTGQEGLTHFGVLQGHVLPVPVPIFFGPGGPVPPGGEPAPPRDGRRGVFRLAPFPRVPMPPIRPPRDP